jgi:N-acetyl-anhydromuramyl-L-alanine amidase AmpD
VNQSISACGVKVDIGIPVVLWDEARGYVCPHKRGREACSQHDPALNGQPTRPEADYRIADLDAAYAELKKTVHQFILHYDVCFCSHHCHRVLSDSSFKGSHFYLDYDGTIYQTCDLYWKTNTAPADDGLGNRRSVHVEISNLSWEARAAEAELFKTETDRYRKIKGRWEFVVPDEYRDKMRIPGFVARPARVYGERGYFSGRINGKVVRMWDFTEEQYRALVRLCVGVNKLLPRVKLQIPYDAENRRTPSERIADFATFEGILGHYHVQRGTDNVKAKYDPGSAFHWSRLRRAFENVG